jgi:hypothetical protein
VGYQTISLGLTLTVPTASTRNWTQQLLTGAWEKISEHDHTGSGSGAQLTGASIAPNLGLVQVGVQVITDASPATVTLDWNGGNIHLIDVTARTAAITIALSNPTAGASYKIFFKNPATALAVTWPLAVKWPQAQAPIWTEALNSVDSVDLYYDAIAGVYYADWQVNYG